MYRVELKVSRMFVHVWEGGGGWAINYRSINVSSIDLCWFRCVTTQHTLGDWLAGLSAAYCTAIYDKFSNNLNQRGCKAINAIKQSVNSCLGGPTTIAACVCEAWTKLSSKQVKRFAIIRSNKFAESLYNKFATSTGRVDPSFLA